VREKGEQGRRGKKERDRADLEVERDDLGSDLPEGEGV
jgi:hypothetical protein